LNQGTRKSGQLAENVESKPAVSVVVVVYNMAREAQPRGRLEWKRLEFVGNLSMGSRMRSKENADASRRELYFDLLVKILTNIIYGDPPIDPDDPANTGLFQPELRSAGRDWPTVAHTMVGLRRLDNVRELAQRVIDEGIPGDFIETGVWRGGCCILMRGVLAANAIQDRKVYAVDSFAGLRP
jgi:O-methyltransferase